MSLQKISAKLQEPTLQNGKGEATYFIVRE